MKGAELKQAIFETDPEYQVSLRAYPLANRERHECKYLAQDTTLKHRFM